MIPQRRSPCFLLASQPWIAEFFRRRLFAQTLTTYPSARLMGKYPISLHPRKSPKSPAWIFDERCVVRPITKRRLSPIPLTGQPLLSFSFGNQKQMFHGSDGPFKRSVDTTVMYVWKISSATCWKCIRIQNLIKTWDTFLNLIFYIYIFHYNHQQNDKLQPIYFLYNSPACVCCVWPPMSLQEHMVCIN